MNLSREAGDLGLIPVQGTKIPHAMEQLSPHTPTLEPAHHNKRSHTMQRRSHESQLRPEAGKEICEYF